MTKFKKSQGFDLSITENFEFFENEIEKLVSFDVRDPGEWIRLVLFDNIN